MRTETRTVHIGEWLGPVDPGYDFTQHRTVNHDFAERGFAMILQMAEQGWRYSPCGFSTSRVVRVGMYDGWPFWRPTPAIGYIGPLDGVEVAFFYNLNSDNCRRGSAR